MIASLPATVRLLTFHCNKPEFIQLQCETFQKFVEDDYELIVINDAKTQELEQAIEKMCDRYHVRCVRYLQEWHLSDPLNLRILEWLQNPQIYSYHAFFERRIACIANQPSVRHSHVLQYALENFGYHHDDIIALIDGDVFPIRPINIRKLLGDRDIVAVRKRLPGDVDDPLTRDQIDYLWVTFVAFHPRKIPDVRDLQFQVDLIQNKIHDTGSATYHYLQNHPDLSLTLFPRSSSQQLGRFAPRILEKMGFNPREIQFIKGMPEGQFVEVYVDHKLLHFCNSCWDHWGYQQKTRYVKQFIDEIIGGEDET